MNRKYLVYVTALRATIYESRGASLASLQSFTNDEDGYTGFVQFLRNRGVVRLRELVAAGINATTISRMERAGEVTESTRPFIDTLRAVMADVRSPFVPDLPRFTGGAVGYQIGRASCRERV